jgi:hypothetical protein
MLTLLQNLLKIKMSAVHAGQMIVYVHVLSMPMSMSMSVSMSMFFLRVHVHAECQRPCCISMFMLHGLEHAGWTWTCSISKSVLPVQVHTVCPCPCCMSISILLHVHAACHVYARGLCPYCMSMSMLCVYVHLERVHGQGRKHMNIIIGMDMGIQNLYGHTAWT